MPGLDNMKKRLDFAGGNSDGRLVKSKLTSFHYSLNNSYQAEWITLNGQKQRCLINPDRLKEDYDQKVLSIDFNTGVKEGDVFLWDRTNTYWLTYLQEFAEEAYYRAEIRRCNYQLSIDKNKYWIYLKGPDTNKMDWGKEHNIAINELNYFISIYITKTSETAEFFQRNKIIKFDNHNWRVESVDRYSQKNVLEVILKESFDNTMEDAVIAPEIIQPDITQPYIDGPQFIDVFSENNIYSIVNATNGTFVVNSTKVEIASADTNSCTINVLSGKASSFEIIYKRDLENDIVLPVTIRSF